MATHIIRPDSHGEVSLCRLPIDPHHQYSITIEKAAGLNRYQREEEEHVCEHCLRELAGREKPRWQVN